MKQSNFDLNRLMNMLVHQQKLQEQADSKGPPRNITNNNITFSEANPLTFQNPEGQDKVSESNVPQWDDASNAKCMRTLNTQTSKL